VHKLNLLGQKRQNVLLIMDDLGDTAYASKAVSNLFSKISNHEKIRYSSSYSYVLSPAVKVQ
jgi:hypothetical protein